MTFILPLLALTVCFYGYVFVNFQKELAGNRRKKISGAVTIPLHVQHCQENEPEQSSRSSEEVYQVESPYLGPLLLVPRRNENVTHGARTAHAPLVSAMYATAAGGPSMDSDHGNVIQITASASARS
jgi:hypothetical protein